MGFSLWVEVNHPDGYSSNFDIVDGQTYNLSPMWRLAWIIPEDESISWLDGQSCAELQPRAIRGLTRYWEKTSDFAKLDPENGWGDHEGFYTHGLLPFAERVHQHPTGVIRWAG